MSYISKDFNAIKVRMKCVQWIKDWFEENGKDCNAVIGISGGKDSTVVAALCVEALGRDRVIGVMMPKGNQADIADSYKVIDFLKIRAIEVNIASALSGIYNSLSYPDFNSIGSNFPTTKTGFPAQVENNLPPRVRMAVLYAVSQSMNGRVINTSNKSEKEIGWFTKGADELGDMSPLGDLTASEVVEIGKTLGLPRELVEKAPSDGLTGKTDEDNFGFTYDQLDEYIRDGECKDEKAQEKITERVKKNSFKQRPMEVFYSEFDYRF